MKTFATSYLAHTAIRILSLILQFIKRNFQETGKMGQIYFIIAVMFAISTGKAFG